MTNYLSPLINESRFSLFNIAEGLNNSLEIEILIAIIRNFISDAEQGGIANMNRAFDNRDWSEVTRIVLEIQEQSRHMGTNRMSEACNNFIDCYYNERKKDLYQLYPQLLKVIEETLAKLREVSDRCPFPPIEIRYE